MKMGLDELVESLGYRFDGLRIIAGPRCVENLSDRPMAEFRRTLEVDPTSSAAKKPIGNDGPWNATDWQGKFGIKKAQVTAEMRALFAAGNTVRQIAEKFGISASTVSKMMRKGESDGVAQRQKAK